jgi:hypothetical protein
LLRAGGHYRAVLITPFNLGKHQSFATNLLLLSRPTGATVGAMTAKRILGGAAIVLAILALLAVTPALPTVTVGLLCVAVAVMI